MAHLPIDSHALRASSILPPGLATVHLDSFQPCPWTYFLRFAGLFGAEYSGFLEGGPDREERGAAGHEIASLWGSPLFHRRSHSFLARNGQRTVRLLRFRGGD